MAEPTTSAYKKGDLVYVSQRTGYNFETQVGLVIEMTMGGSIRVQYLETVTIEETGNGTGYQRRYRVKFGGQDGDQPQYTCSSELFKRTKSGDFKHCDNTLDGIASLEALKTRIFEYTSYN